MVQVRVYFETLMTKHKDQILEFTREDLIGKPGAFMQELIKQNIS